MKGVLALSLGVLTIFAIALRCRAALFVSRPSTSKVPFIENNIRLVECAREKVA
jgi:hypothetical protein